MLVSEVLVVEEGIYVKAMAILPQQKQTKQQKWAKVGLSETPVGCVLDPAFLELTSLSTGTIKIS